ncbi:MAG: hypothetical protein ABSF00_06995 [Candidatus Bathyarchaeia archaeon]
MKITTINLVEFVFLLHAGAGWIGYPSYPFMLRQILPNLAF